MDSTFFFVLKKLKHLYSGCVSNLMWPGMSGVGGPLIGVS